MKLVDALLTKRPVGQAPSFPGSVQLTLNSPADSGTSAVPVNITLNNGVI